MSDDSHTALVTCKPYQILSCTMFTQTHAAYPHAWCTHAHTCMHAHVHGARMNMHACTSIHTCMMLISELGNKYT